LNEVKYRGERVALARRGKPVAVLVPVEDAEYLELLEDAMDMKAAREALAQGKFITLEELRADLGF
jgi:prevent-host-death family protein